MGFFPGLTRDQLPDGEGWGIEQLQINTHNGTHMDAPYHHHFTMNGGERAITINEVPLDWCMNPGVRLDFRALPEGLVLSAAEVEAELTRIGHELQPLDIVVVNTAAGAAYGGAIISIAAAAWGATSRFTCWNAACGSPAPMPGPGMRRSRRPRVAGPKPAIRR